EIVGAALEDHDSQPAPAQSLRERDHHRGLADAARAAGDEEAGRQDSIPFRPRPSAVSTAMRSAAASSISFATLATRARSSSSPSIDSIAWRRRIEWAAIAAGDKVTPSFACTTAIVVVAVSR